MIRPISVIRVSKMLELGFGFLEYLYPCALERTLITKGTGSNEKFRLEQSLASTGSSSRIDSNRETNKSRSCRCHSVSVAPFTHRCPTGFLFFHGTVDANRSGDGGERRTKTGRQRNAKT